MKYHKHIGSSNFLVIITVIFYGFIKCMISQSPSSYSNPQVLTFNNTNLNLNQPYKLFYAESSQQLIVCLYNTVQIFQRNSSGVYGKINEFSVQNKSYSVESISNDGSRILYSNRSYMYSSYLQMIQMKVGQLRNNVFTPKATIITPNDKVYYLKYFPMSEDGRTIIMTTYNCIQIYKDIIGNFTYELIQTLNSTNNSAFLKNSDSFVQISFSFIHTYQSPPQNISNISRFNFDPMIKLYIQQNFNTTINYIQNAQSFFRRINWLNYYSKYSQQFNLIVFYANGMSYNKQNMQISYYMAFKYVNGKWQFFKYWIFQQTDYFISFSQNLMFVATNYLETIRIQQFDPITMNYYKVHSFSFQPLRFQKIIINNRAQIFIYSNNVRVFYPNQTANFTIPSNGFGPQIPLIIPPTYPQPIYITQSSTKQNMNFLIFVCIGLSALAFIGTNFVIQDSFFCAYAPKQGRVKGRKAKSKQFRQSNTRMFSSNKFQTIGMRAMSKLTQFKNDYL